MKTRFMVLLKIQEGITSLKGIAKALERDRATIREHLNRLERDGLITREPLKLLEKGKNILLNMHKEKVVLKKTNRYKKEPQAYDIVRLHKIWISLGYTTNIPTGKKNIMNKSYFIDTQQNGTLMRTFSNGRTLINPKPFWNTTYQNCHNDLLQWLQNWHKLNPNLPFQPKILTAEVAYINEYNIRKEKIKPTKIKVYDTDGKLSLITDTSFKDPEIDLIHPQKHPQHAQLLEHHYTQIITGQTKQIHDQFPQLKKEHDQLAELIKAQNETLKQTLIQNQIIIKQIEQLGGFKK